MTQWVDLPGHIRDNILSYIHEDTWRDQRLSSVDKEWQQYLVDNHHRRGGTIFLTAITPTNNFSWVFGNRGLNIATLYKLAFHSSQSGIPPTQYDRVEIQPNILEYPRILMPDHHIEVDNLFMSLSLLPEDPMAYDNITTLDCHDRTSDDVTDYWQSLEMALRDLFEYEHTFVSHLLCNFFLNVTTLNLSGTKWTVNAEHSIPFRQLQKLIWKKGLCFDLLLPHLSQSGNLLELQLDYTTFEVDYRTVPNLMDLTNNHAEFTIFHNLQYCTQLKIFSCAHSKIYWSPNGPPNVPKPIPILYPHIGEFCTRWLLERALWSLREYRGPLDTREQGAILRRYRSNDNDNSSVIQLIPAPQDNRDWV